jgi:hypothetical protein
MRELQGSPAPEEAEVQTVDLPAVRLQVQAVAVRQGRVGVQPATAA